MSQNAGNAKTAYETATDQGEKWREKMAGKIEVTWSLARHWLLSLAFHETGCLGLYSWVALSRNKKIIRKPVTV